jgi:dTMP kinase
MAAQKGAFITFEGGEGAGKTTLIDKIAEILFARRFSVIKTREPGGTFLGEEIRNLVLNHRAEGGISPFAELCLFLASRAEHIKQVILPALKGGKIVLCDRFNDSTIAYQGYARNLGMQEVESFCSFISQNLKPDLTLYLDIDPLLGLKRVKKEPLRASKGGLDRIESEHLSFHQKIREGFHLIAKKEPERFFMIDSSQPKDKVLEFSIELIAKKLSL